MTDEGFRNILCPVDFSPHSRDALRYGAAVAGRAGGTLTVLAVNDPLLTSAAAAAAYDPKALAAATDAELRRFVARAIGGAKAVTVTLESTIGQSAPEINKAVKRRGIDLVVMGTHGLSGPGKWFFGSTTEHVLRTTTVPVLTVPKLASRGRTRDLNKWPGPTAIAAIDLGTDADEDAKLAVQAAGWFGARVLLVHVLAPSRVPGWIGADTAAHDRDRLREAEQALRKLARTSKQKTESLVALGDPVEQLTSVARKTGAQLIVTLLKHRKELFGPARGSISYRALSAGIAPVLAIPTRDRRRTGEGSSAIEAPGP